MRVEVSVDRTRPLPQSSGPWASATEREWGRRCWAGAPAGLQWRPGPEGASDQRTPAQPFPQGLQTAMALPKRTGFPSSFSQEIQ